MDLIVSVWQDFWDSHGFVAVNEQEPSFSQLQLRFFENHCWRFGDTIQFVFDPLHVPPPCSPKPGAPALQASQSVSMLSQNDLSCFIWHWPGWVEMVGNLQVAGGQCSPEDNSTPSYTINGAWQFGQSSGDFLFVSTKELAPLTQPDVELHRWKQAFISSFTMAPQVLGNASQTINEREVTFNFVRNTAGGFNVRAKGSNKQFGAFLLLGTMQHLDQGGAVKFYKIYV